MRVETVKRQTGAAYGCLAAGQSPWTRAWTAGGVFTCCSCRLSEERDSRKKQKQKSKANKKPSKKKNAGKDYARDKETGVYEQLNSFLIRCHCCFTGPE